MRFGFLNYSLCIFGGLILFGVSCSQLSVKEGVFENVKTSDIATSAVQSGAAVESVDPGGRLGLKELTAMAIAASPKVAEARGKLNVAGKRRLTAWDLRDPELRSSFDWEDSGDRDETVGAVMRFYTPNPWEMRAKMLEVLEKENYADFVLKQVVWDVIHEVRSAYQDLQFLQEKIRLKQGNLAIENDELKRLELLLKEGQITRSDVDQARMRVLKQRGGGTPDRLELQQGIARLAAMAGLEEPTRIDITGVPSRRLVGFSDDALTTLTEVAYMNSLDLGELKLDEALARVDMKALDAKKIPWLSFIDAGVDRNYRNAQSSMDSYGVRASVTMPFFSWLSRESEVYKAQIDSSREQMARRQKQIRWEIAGAVLRVRQASEAMAGFDADTSDLMKEISSLDGSVPNASYIKSSHTLDRNAERLSIEKAYHKALLDLEQLIRTDIEEVFNRKTS